MSQIEDVLPLIEQLTAIGASAVESGLALASGGNLSARHPGSDRFVVTGSGTWLDRLKVEDFSLMSLDGHVLSGNPKPSSEWRLHQRSYQVRSDVNSVVHVHPQHAVLVDALGHDIRLITLDHAVYVKSIGKVPFYHNGSELLAEAAAEEAKRYNCMVLSNHGCSALGDSVEMAFRRALNLEEAATTTYRALALGDKSTTFPRRDFEILHHA